jgi:hypothetical protein
MRCPLLYAVAKPKPRKYLGSLGRGATHNPRGHWGRLGLRGSLLDLLGGNGLEERCDQRIGYLELALA